MSERCIVIGKICINTSDSCSVVINCSAVSKISGRCCIIANKIPRNILNCADVVNCSPLNSVTYEIIRNKITINFISNAGIVNCSSCRVIGREKVTDEIGINNIAGKINLSCAINDSSVRLGIGILKIFGLVVGEIDGNDGAYFAVRQVVVFIVLLRFRYFRPCDAF